jgi:hypothetical protein
MTTLIFTFKQLAVFGEFLRLGYAKPKNLNRLTELAKLILLDMDATRALAHENRIWTNIIAIIVETPFLYQTLDSAQKAEFKKIYMENWRTAELIKRQLVEISKELEYSNTAPILMIKGGLRLYDGLYPTITHRYMADLDLVFTDLNVLKVLANLGYQPRDLAEFDLIQTTQEYLDWQKTQNHHLPPIAAPNHPRSLEMHQHFVHLRAVKFCREGTIQRGSKIANLPKILAPYLVDQLILNLLHTKYGDMFTDYSNFRLRNIFEGYLLYHQLSDTEQSEFENHFSSIERHDDVVFWKYLCLRLFDAQEFAGHYPPRIKAKFMLHARFGQNSRANAILYCTHFVYRLLSKNLWSAQARHTLLLKIKDGNKRQEFWKKFTRIFKR